MEAAANSWSGFPAAFATLPLELHVAVEHSNADQPDPAPPDYRGREHLFMISGGRDSAVCDHERGFAFCRLSESTARRREFTAYYYLEAMALHLLTQLYLTPVHAACVSTKGAGVLLCGESGAGKTSLAYACARRGWCYVSDNESWLLRDRDAPDRTLVALGNPHRIRFRDSAPELFPELRGQPPFLFANGKLSLALDLRCRNDFPTGYRANVSHLVFLDRGGDPRLRPLSKEQALQNLLNGVPAYSLPVRLGHEASLRRLVCAETVCLSYQSLESGVDLLEELVGR